jgi:hypothetical protein
MMQGARRTNAFDRSGRLLGDAAPILPGYTLNPQLILVFGDMVSPDRSQAI